jgi:hypothetical protein
LTVVNENGQAAGILEIAGHIGQADQTPVTSTCIAAKLFAPPPFSTGDCQWKAA